jgi:hypothetical protein
MLALAAWLDIDWSASLLSPTFNRRQIPANSRFMLPAGGRPQGPLDRWRVELDNTERSRIEEPEPPEYDAVCELADYA